MFSSGSLLFCDEWAKFRMEKIKLTEYLLCYCPTFVVLCKQHMHATNKLGLFGKNGQLTVVTFFVYQPSSVKFLNLVPNFYHYFLRFLKKLAR